MKRKVLAAIALAIGAMLIFFAGVSYGAASIRLIVNGKDIASDVSPFIQNGRTFVPIRFVAEALGYPVKWDGNTRIVYVGIPPEGADLEPYEFGLNRVQFSLSSPARIAGVNYSRGFKLYDARFNLSGHYSVVNFSMGMLDNEPGPAKVIAYGDGKELAVLDLTKSDSLKDFTVGVNGIKQLELKAEPNSEWWTANPAVINVRGQK